jgi:hypothetical protein
MIDTEPTSLESWTHTLHDREMPIFSSTTQKIQALINEDKKSASDLANIIMHDPNLSAKVLKISNTIYYNLSSRKMLTITRAIIVLGFAVIKVMCQHFYGHKIKLLLSTFRNQQVTCNHSLNDVVYGYKKPRYIQRFLALLLRGLQSHNDAPALS